MIRIGILAYRIAGTSRAPGVSSSRTADWLPVVARTHHPSRVRWAPLTSCPLIGAHATGGAIASKPQMAIRSLH
jgi:hypothetical protein